MEPYNIIIKHTVPLRSRSTRQRPGRTYKQMLRVISTRPALRGLFSGLFAGQEVFKNSRVVSGKEDFEISRVGPGQPDPTRPDPTREFLSDQGTTLVISTIMRVP